MKVVEGIENSSGKRFAVVAARWHEEFSEGLIEGAVRALTESGCKKEDILLVRAPGSFEIPLICKKLAISGNFAGVIALGTLLRGDTDHYRLIADELVRGLGRAMDESGVPVTFGIITADTEEHAQIRSGNNRENKGFEAALAAVEAASVLEQLGSLK